MIKLSKEFLRGAAVAVFCSLLLACGGGGGGSGESSAPTPPGAPPEPVAMTQAEAARFLSQATFGPDAGSIAAVVDGGPEAWLIEQLKMPATLHLQDVLAQFPEDGRFLDDQGNPLPEIVFTASNSFWEKAISADDQLRQRMAYALSQILVVSAQSDLFRAPQMVAAYMDVLTQGAFGSFRALLENVTYSPAMAVYLTYLRNQKADPSSGRVPDENYARELMQLFTIGLVELNPDGTPATGPDGKPRELFDNDDITGLAKVFTGLSFRGAGFNTRLRNLPLPAFYQPLQMFDTFHSPEAKTFLGTAIAVGTNGEESIGLALDAIFAHPNVGPFLSRQLIQRFVTSHPTPAYVQRVAGAFDSGAFVLPNGQQVGSGVRGDLGATVAAILFDAEARSADSPRDSQFGKLREPVIRFTHWARAFQINSSDASNERLLQDTGSSGSLGQHPYRSPSVFNFYRPGYIAPGTETGAAGLTNPEFQIANATSLMGYANIMTLYALGRAPQIDPGRPNAYLADYQAEAALANDPAALLDRLDLLLTHGTLTRETRERVTEALEVIPPNSEESLQIRARLASVMVMTSPEYIVLR